MNTQNTETAADIMSAAYQLGYGIGLRSKHYSDILSVIEGQYESKSPLPDWYEIISENYLDNHGYSRSVLLKIAEHFPVVMHGVSLSIGSTDPLNTSYLNKLKQLSIDIEPAWISDHICWTGVNNLNSHDLLPIPFNQESLEHLISRVIQVQDFLQRPLVLENPSTYVNFIDSDMPEWHFLNELVARTDCKLLLDVNNLHVSSFNLGFDAYEYLQQLNHQSIVQLHLAGAAHCGTHIIDTHDQAVTESVWELYHRAQEFTGGVASLLEWDSDIPDFSDILEELDKAREIVETGFSTFKKTTKISKKTKGTTVPHTPVSNPVNFVMD